MKRLVSILCIIMMLWFLLPCFTGQIFNFGTITGFLLFLILYLLAAYPAVFTTLPFFLKTICIIFLVCIIMVISVCTFKMIQASRIKPQGNETVIILGGGLNGEKPSLMLEQRLETAANYLHRHPDLAVVVSGGKGEDEDIPEALAMARWLKNHDVTNPIYLEDASINTDQNLRFSKIILESNSLSTSVIIVTDGFHEYRADLLCKKYGLRFHSLPVHTRWWLFPTFYMREILAIIKQWLFG